MADHGDASTAREEILALEREIYGDPASRHDIDHVLAADFWEVSASGETISRAQLLERLAANPMIIDSYPVEDARVDVHGDVAISTGHATVYGRIAAADGSETRIERAQRFVHIWLRTPDGWRVTYSQSSPAEP